jgi:hypothetical protein
VPNQERTLQSLKKALDSRGLIRMLYIWPTRRSKGHPFVIITQMLYANVMGEANPVAVGYIRRGHNQFQKKR